MNKKGSIWVSVLILIGAIAVFSLLVWTITSNSTGEWRQSIIQSIPIIDESISSSNTKQPTHTVNSSSSNDGGGWGGFFSGGNSSSYSSPSYSSSDSGSWGGGSSSYSDSGGWSSNSSSSSSDSGGW